MTVTAFRIVKEKYGPTIWSGDGARDYGGRWNSRGTAIVYTAESRSLAALEQLVHLIKPRVLEGYLIASIRFDDTQLRYLKMSELPKGWDAAVAPPALKKFGDSFVASGALPVLAVPSAVVPNEWNYLFNPAHADFARMQKSASEPFTFDNRLR